MASETWLSKEAKNCINFDLRWFSNSCFYITTVLTFFIKVTALYLRKGLYIDVHWFLLFQRNFHDWQEMLKNAIVIVNLSIFKLFIFQSFSLELFQQVANRQLSIQSKI